MKKVSTNKKKEKGKKKKKENKLDRPGYGEGEMS